MPCCHCSVSKSCPTLCNPMNCSRPGCPFAFCQSLLKFTSIEMVMLSNLLILYILCPETEPRGQASMEELCHLLSGLLWQCTCHCGFDQKLPTLGTISAQWLVRTCAFRILRGQRNRLLSQKFYLVIWNSEKSFSLISEMSSLVLPSHEWRLSEEALSELKSAIRYRTHWKGF